MEILLNHVILERIYKIMNTSAYDGNAIRGRRLQVKRQSPLVPQEMCCDLLKAVLLDEEQVLVYWAYKRRYLIQTIDQHIVQEVNGCPFCGKKFPEPIDEDVWEHELAKIIGEKKAAEIEAPYDVGVPHEFQCEDWWRKRDL